MNLVNKCKIRLSTFTNCSIYQNEYNIYHKVKNNCISSFCLFFTIMNMYYIYICNHKILKTKLKDFPPLSTSHLKITE